MKKILTAIVMIMLKMMCAAQTITILDSGTKVSLRGLSVADENTVWASGSNGYVARSIDGGKTFAWQQVEGYKERDFRDIEAFDANVAVAMAIDRPSIILKTIDGGKTWKEVFKDTTAGMFLDAMDFDDNGNGIVIGDPIKNRLFFAATSDYGNTWKSYFGVKVNEGEALFAASGSNIKLVDNNRIYVTGGTRSRLFITDDAVDLSDIVQGKESTGANSIAVYNKQHAIIVGGDFSNDSISQGNCILYTMTNKKFQTPQTAPHGYKSCVVFITENKLITCGTSGVDISNDSGMNWQSISDQSFHVCVKAKKGNAVFLAGSNGKIAKLE